MLTTWVMENYKNLHPNYRALEKPGHTMWALLYSLAWNAKPGLTNDFQNGRKFALSQCLFKICIWWLPLWIKLGDFGAVTLGVRLQEIQQKLEKSGLAICYWILKIEFLEHSCWENMMIVNNTDQLELALLQKLSKISNLTVAKLTYVCANVFYRNSINLVPEINSCISCLSIN